MMFPVAVIGNNVKELLAPYWKFADMRWHDVTDFEFYHWRIWCKKRGNDKTFQEWLEFGKFWKCDSLPEKPFQDTRRYMEHKGVYIAFRYANPQGWWSYRQCGENYTDFLLLKNEETAWQALLCELDIERDIEITGRKMAMRWETVREEARKGPPPPWRASRALSMEKNDYVALRTAQCIVPEALVLKADMPMRNWLWLWKLPPRKRLRKYLAILKNLPQSEIITIVECHT